MFAKAATEFIVVGPIKNNKEVLSAIFLFAFLKYT